VLLSICTEEFKFDNLVDFVGIVFSVESVIGIAIVLRLFLLESVSGLML